MNEELNDEVKKQLAGFPLPASTSVCIQSIMAYGDGDIVMKHQVKFFDKWVTKHSYLQEGGQ